MGGPSWPCEGRTVLRSQRIAGSASRLRWSPQTSRRSSPWGSGCTSGWPVWRRTFRQCERLLPQTELFYWFQRDSDPRFVFRSQRLKFRLNLYELKEGRQIKPKTFMSMVSNLLYERRFGPYYIEPVIAGLDPKSFEPFICSLDLIGCPMVTEDFVVSGTCSEQMYGMCESLWEPDLEPEDLFETISQAMLNAVDRDAVSGMGVVVHVIEKDKITTRTLKARMD
ncbi:proteasome subunit beta type-3 isoform X2 [Oryzias latipes]|uniref:Proteasome subunit beta type-3 n=1 Tax=Oryzias latipes TaxID=8090 RepID=A0A3B3HUC7_ORYLA|nr:proteasome subunit beta type-3 isoform X2 [Oryzias latipes]